MRPTTLIENDRTAGIAGMASGGGDLVGAADGFGAMAAGTTEIVYTARKVEVMRDDARVLAKIKAHAAVAGTDWFYRFPVRNKDGGKDFIEGPSIKCANSVARLYGNCQIDTVVKDMGRTWIIYARFIDHETGFSYMRPFQQDKFASKMGGKGPEADARRLDIALQIGTSKAIRNVICNALETFANFAFEEAKKDLIGRIGKDLPRFKEMSKKRLDEMKIDIKRVETMYGRTFDQWLASEIARLAAEMKAIDDGMATADETWPPPAPPAPPAPTRKQFTDGENGDAPDPTDGQADGGAQQADAQPGASKGEGATAKPAADQHPANPPTTAKVDDLGLPLDAKDPLQSQANISAAKTATPAPAETAKPKKSWAVDADVVGQDNKFRAVSSLLTKTATAAEVDEVEAAHADFLAKLGMQKKSEWRQKADGRKAELNEGRDE